jgi:uncharacterized protein YdhG (YjbR/CyaY superfamily)
MSFKPLLSKRLFYFYKTIHEYSRAMSNTPEEYIRQLLPERKEAFLQLRSCILENLPGGFQEQMSYGMIGYVVPHSLYPKGYHCNPQLPLPFISIASQKNFIALYHMGLYADQSLMEWFITRYNESGLKKPDMGKSCIRFKKMNDIPFQLIGELVQKCTPKQWIKLYESAFR